MAARVNRATAIAKVCYEFVGRNRWWIPENVPQLEDGHAMPWETRSGHRYYYRVQRKNGRLIKEYFGRGVAAEAAAQVDAEARQQRTAERVAVEAAKRHTVEVE